MDEQARVFIEVTALLISVGGILFKLGGMTKEFRLIGLQQAAEISDLKVQIEKLGEVLIEQAKADGRMRLMEERQLAEGKRIDTYQAAISRQIELLSASMTALAERVNRYLNGTTDH
jgi:hypothetical protein